MHFFDLLTIGAVACSPVLDGPRFRLPRFTSGLNYGNLSPVLPTVCDRVKGSIVSYISRNKDVLRTRAALATNGLISRTEAVPLLDDLESCGHIQSRMEKIQANGVTARIYTLGPVPYVEPPIRFQFKGEVFDSIADIAAMVRRERLLDDTISGTLPDPVDQECDDDDRPATSIPAAAECVAHANCG